MAAGRGAGEVGDHAVQSETRVVGGERTIAARNADALTSCGTYVARPPGPAEGVQQQPGLHRRTGAQLDERVGLRERGDLVDGAVQQDARSVRVG